MKSYSKWALGIVLISQFSCIKSESKSKAIGTNDEKSASEMLKGSEVQIPLIFQEKFGTATGSLVSCLYEETRTISIGENGDYIFGERTGEVTKLTEKAVVWTNLVFSSMGAANTLWKATMADETKRSDAAKTIGSYALIFLAKRLMPSGEQSNDDGTGPTPSSGPSLQDLMGGSLVDLKDAAFGKITQAIGVSKTLSKLVGAIQSDGLQEGEIKGLVDPMSYSVFKALIMQAGKDSKSEACRGIVEVVK